MASFKQSYGAETSLTISLNGLANNTAASSLAVDNSTNKYDEIILEIKVGGTATATSWLDVRIVASVDGGTDFSSYTTPYLVLPAIDMSVDNPIYHARFVPPQQWKLYVLNKTGAVLDVGAASYQGVTYISE
jgi:hypothetical protein